MKTHQDGLAGSALGSLSPFRHATQGPLREMRPRQRVRSVVKSENWSRRSERWAAS
jgi:hypothetical protein